jgi:hypothetical protein
MVSKNPSRLKRYSAARISSRNASKKESDGNRMAMRLGFA